MADYGQRKYRLDHSRLKRSLRQGFRLTAEGKLTTERDAPRRHCILSRLDGNLEDCPWGRLAMDAVLEGDLVVTVRAFASNDRIFLQGDRVTDVDEFLLDPGVPVHRKEQLFGMGGGVQYSGHRDVLLYGQRGRYLWLWLEVNGHGSAVISDLRVYAPGDNFFETFPEVYRNNGDFFHRYLSIFSSLYNDLDERIDALAEYIDLDTAPAQALPVLAGWLGLELEYNCLTEGELRRLLKAAFPLLCAKGTRRAVEGVVRLFVEEDVYIVERNLLAAGQVESAMGLYGETPFDFTILIDRHYDESLRSKLQMLVEQFKPVRSRAHIVFLRDCEAMDRFTYLDVNGAVGRNMPGSLDEGVAITGAAYLQYSQTT